MPSAPFGGLVSFYLTYTLIFPNSPAFSVGQLNPHGYRAVRARSWPSRSSPAVLVTTHLTRREIPYLLQPVVGDAALQPGAGRARRWRARSKTASS